MMGKPIPKVFIGSSSRAVERGIVPELTLELGRNRDFEVIPWTYAFEEGSYFLETLLNQLEQVDFALLVFAADDVQGFADKLVKERDAKVISVARDNVVLEYGLFLAGLGRNRVWILKEEAVKLPSNLDGLSVSQFFDWPGQPVFHEHLKKVANDIRERWSKIPPKNAPLDDLGIGLGRTIEQRRIKYQNMQEVLLSQHVDRPLEPFYLDSTEASRQSYVDALNLVKERFWTTTYISSGFWAKPDALVLGANTDMLQRNPRVQARRLFLLSKSPHDEAKSYKERLIHHRRLKENLAIQTLKNDFRTLRNRIQTLMEQSCEVKVGHDEYYVNELGNVLGPHFDPDDSELAIYDSFRVDIFGGGRIGRIVDLRIYSKILPAFKGVLQSATTYFEKVWEGASDPDTFLGLMESAFELAEKRIDYASNWLARYEFALPAERGLQGNIMRYLDIGTCTGRYPRHLRDIMSPRHGVRETAETKRRPFASSLTIFWLIIETK